MTELLNGLLISTVLGAVLAALLLFAKPFVKDKISKESQYFSWNLVLFRMLLPFSVGVLAVGNLIPFVHSPASLIPTGGGTSSAAQSVTSSAATSPGSAVSSVFSPADVDSAIASPVNIISSAAPSPFAAANTQQTANTAQPAHSYSFFVIHWQTLLFIIWLSGVIVMLGIHIAGYNRYASKIKAGRVLVEDEDALALLKECGEKYGITKPLPLYVSSVTDTPMLCGLFRCSVVLPDGRFTPEQFRYAFWHELAHCRRHDNLLKWIAVLAVSVNWFNPVVYLAAREAGRLCELSCDETVTKGFSREQRIDYGRTLLSVASDTVRRPFALSATMSEDKRSLKERLERLTKTNKESKRNAILTVSAVFAVVAITAFTLMVCGAKKAPHTEQSSDSHSSDTGSSLPDSSAITPETDSSTVSSQSKPQIINTVSDELKAKFSDIDITNEWIGNYGSIALFGSLKSDPTQGVAMQTGDGQTFERYLTPSKHGAVTVQNLLGSSSAVQVSAMDGHVWVFDVYYGFSEKQSGGVYAGKWAQLDLNLLYVEGTVVSLQNNTDGTAVLNLKITVNYHLYADPVDNPDIPYKIGSTQEFILQKLPGIRLNTGEDIVLYYTGVHPLSGSMDSFDGAAVMYYKNGDQYFDMSGKTAAMPPQDYPSFGDVFDSGTGSPPDNVPEPIYYTIPKNFQEVFIKNKKLPVSNTLPVNMTFSVPKNWSVDTSNTDQTIFASFKDKTETIGTLETEAYYLDSSSQPIDQVLPNHSETISVNKVDGLSYDCYIVKLEISSPAAASSQYETSQTYAVFLRNNSDNKTGNAFSFIFDDQDVSGDTINEIMKTVQFN